MDVVFFFGERSINNILISLLDDYIYNIIILGVSNFKIIRRNLIDRLL